MQVKRVKIGVRPAGTIFDEAAAAIRHIEAGHTLRAHGEWLYTIKNVTEDLELLVSLGLVEMEARDASGKKHSPHVGYETLTVEVHLA